MSKILAHKGYQARVEFDDQDGIFVGKIAGIRDGVGFHADSVTGLREAFIDAVEDYLAICARINKDPNKPYSGQVMFRIKPETHRRVAQAAELAGKSLNQWAEDVLSDAVSA